MATVVQAHFGRRFFAEADHAIHTERQAFRLRRGACTVHLEGEATRSCVLPASAVAGRAITTIEVLSPDAVADCLSEL